MSKFNTNTIGNRQTVNHEGAPAYKMSLKDKLVSQVLTSFFGEKKFYGDNTNDMVNTVRQMLDVDPEFVANLAKFTREQFYLRSTPQALVTELANHTKGKPYARETINRVAQRVDDMTEILAYQLATYGKPIPNSLKKGVADAFGKFDEYQLAKYDRDGKAVTLKDAFRLVSPSAKKGTERYDLYKRLLEGNLEVPMTWETQLSARGNTKEVWEELIDSGKLGYMAQLRNLRSIINSGATNVDKVYDFLRDPEKVKRSKQLPFRFLSAYKVAQSELYGAGSKPLDVLSDALESSIDNLPRLKGTTFMAADTSPSMNKPISANSKVTQNDIGTLLMAMAHKMCDNAITSVFGDHFKLVNVSTRDSVLTNMRQFQATQVGYATHLYKAIEWLIREKKVVDRILVFSDMQVYGGRNGWGGSNDDKVQGLVDRYRREVNPDVWVHSFDLNGYGTQQFIGKNTNLVAGWSDKVLDFIELAETGTGSLVKTIENYQ